MQKHFEMESAKAHKTEEMKVAFLTLGCKVNFYETEKMMQDFKEHGFEIVDFNRESDVYIINTCTVTNIADRKSRQMIHRAKKKSPDSIVAAVGCYVESGGEELKKDSSIDVSFSNKDKSSVAVKVLSYLKEIEKYREDKYTEKCAVQGNNTSLERTRKYIKIQDGCNQFCSYCMIPYVRGGGVLSSRDEEDVLAEIRDVASQGFKEVVITGIHLSSYGVDKSEEKQFVNLKGRPLVELLQRIDGIPGIERIRLGSLEPRIICEEFMDELAKVSKLCPHFHLSLQSGCDMTLKRMNRHYTAEEYREKCEMIRRYYEHPAITTDVIAGFPGETEEEFETTRNFVRDCRLADIHVFKYSMRNGTKAAKMENQVSPDIKHKRSEILIAEAEKLKREYADWFVGKEELVLFEEVRKIGETEYLTGHNERYVLFGVPIEEARKQGYAENQIVPVEVREGNLL